MLKRIALKIYKYFKILIVVSLFLITSFYLFFYIKQDSFFFNPKHLDKDYVFNFEIDFEEFNIKVDDNIYLNSLLFKTSDTSKGVVLYYHGNAGAIHEWGERAELYTNNGYDVLFVDYRGYGKSDGKYTKESQFYNDAKKIYNFVKLRYKENEIIVLGFSLGTGFASYTAAINNPKLLILEAPYFSWDESIHNIASIIPRWMIKYKIPSYKFLNDVTCPITIYHGSKDFLIDTKINSEKLKTMYPDKIELTYIKGAGHNGIYLTKQYYDELEILLN